MKKINLTYMFLLFSGVVLAQTGQTVNEGILYVSPGTLVSVESDFDNTDLGEYENNGEVLLKGNFNNDGITTFNPSYTGYTRFEGYTQQNITGSIPADFNNVLFYNSNQQPAFRLYGDISISGNADFYNGIVQNDVFGGIIIFENDATHTNTSDDSFVDGHVIKTGYNNFTYPIGDGQYYRYAAISAPEEISDSFTAKYYMEDSNALYPHENRAQEIELIDGREYWTIERTEGEADVLVTLSWDEFTTTPSELLVEPTEAIRVVRWDEDSQMWVDEGGVQDMFDRTVTTAVHVSGYGVFTLGRLRRGYLPTEDIIIYNGVTPDGDGQNDYFYIEGITAHPGNTVQIFNRWGVMVFETAEYDSHGNVFDGVSSGRATVTQRDKLPAGTYFYVIQYPNQGGTVKKTGYLYISTE
ncbi:gliding motility-associated C-terminal domain-containing protein [Flavobacterium rakeshii]|uniref:gliding motility-associated C-terminal domain-containing protein n=1 Tax=Flavobacterium rakeshii TaxID=1038845 RepID=UPI002E7B9F98|nr:gliding motility-associated C-terminal domain-containing protein [Flavobacterium rakeshii]MEE1898786.1 gliding motility-associated C-terminal domain-containing protein [Flavobacterium rakeshii]